jgi:esterase/lipase superfamily enzyme
MQFACQITKARIQTHTHTVEYLLHHNWSIPSDLMFHGNNYKNWETAQWLICHYNLFSQIVCLKKAMSRQTFFGINAASGTLHENLYIFNFCSDINLPQKHCCTTLNIFIQLTVKYSSTTHTECTVAFPLQQWLHKHATMLRYMHIAYLLKLSLWLNYSRDWGQNWTNIKNDIFPKINTLKGFCARAQRTS